MGVTLHAAVHSNVFIFPALSSERRPWVVRLVRLSFVFNRNSCTDGPLCSFRGAAHATHGILGERSAKRSLTRAELPSAPEFTFKRAQLTLISR